MPSVNLIPARILERRECLERQRIWGLSALLAWCLVLIPVIREQQAKGQLTHQWAVMEEISHRLNDSRRQVQASVEALAAQDRRLELARTLREKRAWSNLLSTTLSVLPEKVWLTALATDRPRAGDARGRKTQAPFEAAEDERAPGRLGPRRLMMHGQALRVEDVYAFVAALEELVLYQDIALRGVAKSQVGDVKVTSFTLECSW